MSVGVSIYKSGALPSECNSFSSSSVPLTCPFSTTSPPPLLTSPLTFTASSSVDPPFMWTASIVLAAGFLIGLGTAASLLVLEAVLVGALAAAAGRDDSGVLEGREESGVLAAGVVADLGAVIGVLGLAKAAAVAR